MSALVLVKPLAIVASTFALVVTAPLWLALLHTFG
jgi:hypothetical protein